MEAPPSLETMKACGEITLGSQAELGGENFLLSVVTQAGLPAVEADFTDNTWASVEMLLECGQPTWRALVDEPRVQTEAGQHTVVAPGPVGGGGAGGRLARSATVGQSRSRVPLTTILDRPTAVQSEISSCC